MLLFLQKASVDINEVTDSPFLCTIKRSVPVNVDTPVHRRHTPTKDPSHNNRINETHPRKSSNKENSDEFITPETPKTPKGRRPPTIGMSPPVSSTKKSPRPVSAVLPDEKASELFKFDFISTSRLVSFPFCFQLPAEPSGIWRRNTSAGVPLFLHLALWIASWIPYQQTHRSATNKCEFIPWSEFSSMQD